MTFRAGYRQTSIPRPDRPASPALAFYPSVSPEAPTALGPFMVDVAGDGAPAVGRFPLVVISHGTGSAPTLFRDLAAHLARKGFVVVAPEHPGNNRNDNSLAGTEENLIDRPRHLAATIDFAFRAFEANLKPDAVHLIGHSQGGYTILALAGGHPLALQNETRSPETRSVPVVPDPRVKSLVLLAPATPWYMHEGSLDDVRVPILMLTGDRDEHAPPAFAEIVLFRIPDASRIRHRAVPNAGHFSFLSPYPMAMRNPAFPPSQDPPGFDRQHFNGEMCKEVAAFLEENA